VYVYVYVYVYGRSCVTSNNKIFNLNQSHDFSGVLLLCCCCCFFSFFGRPESNHGGWWVGVDWSNLILFGAYFLKYLVVMNDCSSDETKSVQSESSELYDPTFLPKSTKPTKPSHNIKSLKLIYKEPRPSHKKWRESEALGQWLRQQHNQRHKVITIFKYVTKSQWHSQNPDFCIIPSKRGHTRYTMVSLYPDQNQALPYVMLSQYDQTDLFLTIKWHSNLAHKISPDDRITVSPLFGLTIRIHSCSIVSQKGSSVEYKIPRRVFNASAVYVVRGYSPHSLKPNSPPAYMAMFVRGVY